MDPPRLLSVSLMNTGLGTAAVCELINLILPKRYPRGWFTNVFPGAGSAL